MNLADIKYLPVGGVLHDDQVRGLHLRAFEGRKSFYLFYRTKAGRQRRPKIGEWPTIALAQARDIAREMLMAVARGEDPSGEFQTERQAPTVADLWDRFWKDHAKAKKSGHSDELRYNRCIKPNLGIEKVKDVTYSMMKTLHTDMFLTPTDANRVLALASTMFNHAEILGWRPQGTNPCMHVKRYKEKRRKRKMEGDEPAKIARLLLAYEDKNPQAVAFIYMLIFTGARKSEIAKARPHHIVGDKLVLEEHKTDDGGEDRIIHLPPIVKRLIDRLPKTSGTLMGIKDPRALWVKIREEAGCPDLRMHDLRRSFASAALSAGYTLAQVGELLGHASPQTTKGYAYLIDDVAKEAASATADALQAMMARAVKNRPSESTQDAQTKAD